MKRNVRNVRLSPREKQLLETAARRKGMGWSTWLREAALDASVEVLEEEHPDLEREGDHPEEREAVPA